jgi:hypothetical protein
MVTTELAEHIGLLSGGVIPLKNELNVRVQENNITTPKELDAILPGLHNVPLTEPERPEMLLRALGYFAM